MCITYVCLCYYVYYNVLYVLCIVNGQLELRTWTWTKRVMVVLKMEWD